MPGVPCHRQARRPKGHAECQTAEGLQELGSHAQARGPHRSLVGRTSVVHTGLTEPALILCRAAPLQASTQQQQELGGPYRPTAAPTTAILAPLLSM